MRRTPGRPSGRGVRGCAGAGALLLVLGCASPGRAPGGEAEAEVRAWLGGYSAAVAEGDWERVGDLYADDPDFLVLEDGRVRYRSANEVRRALTSMAASFEVSTAFAGTDVIVLAPDRAHVATIVRQRFVGEGRALEFEAALSLLLIRTEAGWKILRAHTSSRREDGRGGGPGPSSGTVP